MNSLALGPQSDALYNGTSSLRMELISSPASQKDLEMPKILPGFANRPKSSSLSSRQTTISINTHNTSTTTASTHNGRRAIKKEVRALPPWLRNYEEDESDGNFDTRMRSSNPPPLQSHTPLQHLSSERTPRRISQDGYVDIYEESTSGINERKQDTGFFGGYREPVKGRKWDHVRDGEPVIVQTRIPQRLLPWRTYIQSSIYAVGQGEECERVDHKYLNQQAPGYQTPWRGDLKESEDLESHPGLARFRKKRKGIMRRIQHILIMHPLVPLLFRLIVLSTSIIALGIATSVHYLSVKYNYEQTPSSTMAIGVDVVALPYILYITWDEYTGKPLGLRAPGAKIRLVLLDLFFIIFESANLSLAFGALTDDNGSCENSVYGYNYIICNRVKALCGILMLALYAWSLTFAISIFRLVQRVGVKEEE
ncbi:Regulator of phospholipase D SRF1 [Erysiphe necator]|uniref:Casparian strip membrane protein domain-containing protein n=1 Tax=Uncinula necator TaxID=52586 RepID=A0A0B1NWG4_UNCNE|nr:Regulator of phospholipase D SRF1 [Erysiphe necator]KHJ30278.1 hypothetical protein EV44_g1186 [Erysiphe necator]